MRVSTVGQDKTWEASVDGMSTQFTFVKPATGVNQQGSVATSTANARAIGIQQNKPTKQGEGVVVRIAGTSKLLVDGTTPIVPGDTLKSDGSGRGVKGASDHDRVGAIAMEPSSVANDIIEVIVVLFDVSA